MSGQHRRYTAKELLTVSDPAWPELKARIVGGRNGPELLVADPELGKRCLEAIQAPVSTVLGAMSYHVGGVLIDGGWLRLLGCGHARMRGSLLSWNGKGGPTGFPGIAGAVIVAHDVLGGVFAVNGGGLFGQPGELNYFDPAEGRWAPLDVRYPAFVVWALDGDLGQLYADRRWEDWDRDVGALSGDQAVVRTPPPWSDPDPAAVQAEVRPSMDLIGERWRVAQAPADAGEGAEA